MTEPRTHPYRWTGYRLSNIARFPRLSVAGIKARRPGFDSRSVSVIFVVNNAALAQVSVVVRREKNQQDATIRCLLLTSISTCFGHHYAHLQENKEPVTAFGVLFWFCRMWLVAVVRRCLEGSEH